MVKSDEDALRKEIVETACAYGRYGYRRVTALLRNEGWHVNHKRVARIWRQEGMKVPQRQPRRRRLWLNDGSCIRLRPEHCNHVWSYDFVAERTSDGRPLRMLNIVDEFSRGCAISDLPVLAPREKSVTCCLSVVHVPNSSTMHLSSSRAVAPSDDSPLRFGAEPVALQRLCCFLSFDQLPYRDKL